MKIMDKLKRSGVTCELAGRDKKEIIEELSVLLAVASGKSPEEVAGVLWEREEMGSTALDRGVGIPHGKMGGLKDVFVCLGVSRKGVDFAAKDRMRTHLFFAFLAPAEDVSARLDLLAKVSRLLSDEAVKNALLKAAGPDEVLAVIAGEERK